MTTSDALLREIYYDPNNSAGLSSVRKLYNAAKLRLPSIKINDVKNWLQAQFTYTLHKPIRKTFTRNPTITLHPNRQWQADLVDMQKFSRSNNGFKYILTVTDIFSKFSHAVPLKDKTGASVVAALSQVFKNSMPTFLQTDRGKEFVNTKVQSFLKAENIRFLAAENSDIKCAVVERFNRTLKSRMWKYFTAKGTTKWVNILDLLVNSYNNTIHSTIKMKPVDVNNSNYQEVFKNMYGYNSMREYLKANVKKSELEPGDTVRLKYKSGPFDKGYIPNWSDVIESVEKTLNGNKKPFIKIKGYSRRFYPEEVQKITGNEFRIEKVIRKRKKDGKSQCLVKWVGYPSTENTWIDEDQISDLKNGEY